MTELTSCIACSTHLDDLKSVGKPAPFFEMKVVDFCTRQPLGPNQQGEVCVKGPAAFKAYWNQPSATSAAYENGFVRTGDKGYYTADGCFFLCGRFKELIKCMDQQVSPAELEELLASDPEVLHVVVAGVPHSQYGEAARAFVVHQRRLTDPLQQQKEAERLKEVVAGRLAYHKQLHSGVEFLDSIPRSEVGKDLRSALKKAFTERLQNANLKES
ncbi:luciferin 4-monooxygenase [Rhipicephalus sanguineus]|uniref:luciferin 4-monooxygenase n=1 Tax=Rhipicephalus sanguineus TaxID=34632 RepID=UPI0020C1C1D1|nr:luciferin 4-monooxygenase [Rhipicephalus sanguineus]